MFKRRRLPEVLQLIQLAMLNQCCTNLAFFQQDLSPPVMLRFRGQVPRHAILIKLFNPQLLLPIFISLSFLPLHSALTTHIQDLLPVSWPFPTRSLNIYLKCLILIKESQTVVKRQDAGAPTTDSSVTPMNVRTAATPMPRTRKNEFVPGTDEP